MDWKRVYKYTKLKGLDYLQESKNVMNMARVFKNKSPKKKPCMLNYRFAYNERLQ